LKAHLILLAILILSCNGQDKEAFVAPQNAVQLISGDSTKTWKLAKRFNDGHRMNMGDCFLSYRVTYSKEMTMSDNNAQNANCGDSLEANWTLITNESGSFIKLTGQKISELLNIDEDYKYFRINALSKDTLVLQFKHMQFSSNSTIIIDYLVPENALVKDRDFHNK